MNKKIVFRILGALSSSLMIIALFVPYMNISGYTQTLWDMYSNDSMYLLIMIIAFGLLGIIFFSLNIKTEFAYMSAGAIAFFCIMMGMDAINQNIFKNLSIGFYFLVVGAFLTGLMAFFSNLRDKNVKTIEDTEQSINEFDNQSDQFSNEQLNNNVMPNVINPIPMEQTISNNNLNFNQTVQNNQLQNQEMLNSNISQNFEQTMVVPSNQLINLNNNINNGFEQPITHLDTMERQQPVNPINEEFPSLNQNLYNQNNINNGFEQPITHLDTMERQQPVNPINEEFPSLNQNLYNQNNINNGLFKSSSTNLEPRETKQQSNYFMNDFIDNNNLSRSVNDQNNNSDIFGQPL